VLLISSKHRLPGLSGVKLIAKAATDVPHSEAKGQENAVRMSNGSVDLFKFEVRARTVCLAVPFLKS
jgi:hypothetical protein